MANGKPPRMGMNEANMGVMLGPWAIELARSRLEPRAFLEATTQATIYDPEGALKVGYLDELVDSPAAAGGASFGI